MKFIFTPIGSGGDVYPFLGLAITLRKRGHDVCVITNGHFRHAVESNGIAFDEFGSEEQYRQAIENPEIFHPLRGFKTVMGFVRDQRLLMEKILTHATRDTVVVAHSLAFAARLLEDAKRIRVVSIVLQPAVLRSVYLGPVMGGNHGITKLPRWMQRGVWWGVDRLLVDPLVSDAVAPLEKELGLPHRCRYFKDWIFSPNTTIGLFPDWFAPIQPDWPKAVRLASFPLCDFVSQRPTPPALQELLTREQPVVFTPGTGNMHAREFFAAGVEACRRLNRPALLLTHHREQLPATLPSGVYHFDFAPLSEILPKCAALVHHGGIGTTAAALAAGIPQIIMPLSHDQPDNAARIVGGGWGMRLWPRQFIPDRLTAVLGELLASDDIRVHCQQASARLASIDGLELACDLIEQAAARGYGISSAPLP